MGKDTHKDIDFEVDTSGGEGRRNFKSFDKAAGYAVTLAMQTKKRVHLDVLISSTKGARAWGGDDGVREYKEDPNASVFDRLDVKAKLLTAKGIASFRPTRYEVQDTHRFSRKFVSFDAAASLAVSRACSGSDTVTLVMVGSTGSRTYKIHGDHVGRVY